MTPPDAAAAAAEQAIRSALQRHVERFLTHEEALRSGDAVAVHQVRVAVRRLRSDLQTYAPLLRGSWGTRLRHRLVPLAKLLGQVRDLDVLHEVLMAYEPYCRGSARLAGRLDGARAEARAGLRTEVAASGHAVLLRDLARAPLRPMRRVAAGPLADTMLALAAARWMALRDVVERLPSQPDPADLHRVRIATKRCRYALQVLALPIPDCHDLMTQTERIQATLGRHHDLWAAERWVHTQQQVPRSLAGRVAADRRAAERMFREQWRQASDPCLARWMLP